MDCSVTVLGRLKIPRTPKLRDRPFLIQFHGSANSHPRFHKNTTASSSSSSSPPKFAVKKKSDSITFHVQSGAKRTRSLHFRRDSLLRLVKQKRSVTTVRLGQLSRSSHRREQCHKNSVRGTASSRTCCCRSHSSVSNCIYIFIYFCGSQNGRSSERKHYREGESPWLSGSHFTIRPLWLTVICSKFTNGWKNQYAPTR